MNTSKHLLVDPGAKVKLSSDHLSTFKPGQVFEFYPDNVSYATSSLPTTVGKRLYLGAPIVSLDFHASGAHLLATTLHESVSPVTAPNYETPTHIQRSNNQENISSSTHARFTTCLHLFNASKGVHNKTVYFDNTLLHKAIFTHHYSTVLTAGHDMKTNSDLSTITSHTPQNNSQVNINNNNPTYLRTLLRNTTVNNHSLFPVSLAYTSLVDSVQLQSFYGHCADVVDLKLNPCHDSFLTSSVDRTIRLWDLRSDISQGVLHLPRSILNPKNGTVSDYIPYGLSTVGSNTMNYDDNDNTNNASTNGHLNNNNNINNNNNNPHNNNNNNNNNTNDTNFSSSAQSSITSQSMLGDDSVVAIDPQGIVFAIAINNSIQLHDFRTLESNTPFATFYLSALPPCVFHSLSFTQDGTAILVSCSSYSNSTPLSRHGSSYFHMLQRSQIPANRVINGVDTFGIDQLSTTPLDLSTVSYRHKLDPLYTGGSGNGNPSNYYSQQQTQNQQLPPQQMQMSQQQQQRQQQQQQASPQQQQLLQANDNDVTFGNFDHVLLIDAFTGQILQRVSIPRSSTPLAKEQLQQVNADSGMVSQALNQNTLTQLNSLVTSSFSLTSSMSSLPLSQQISSSSSAASTTSSTSNNNPSQQQYQQGTLQQQQQQQQHYQHQNMQQQQQQQQLVSPNDGFLRHACTINQQFGTSWYDPILPLYAYQYPLPTLLRINQILSNSPSASDTSFQTTKLPTLSLRPSPFFSLPCDVTADCKFLSLGTSIGTIPTHDVRTGRQIVTFSHQKQAEIQHVRWNPTYTQLVTANPYEIVFWVPSAK